MEFGTAVVILVAAIVLAGAIVGGVALLARRLVGVDGPARAQPPMAGADPTAVVAAQEDMRADLARIEERLIAREEKIEARVTELAERERQVAEREAGIDELREQRIRALESVAGL